MYIHTLELGASKSIESNLKALRCEFGFFFLIFLECISSYKNKALSEESRLVVFPYIVAGVCCYYTGEDLLEDERTGADIAVIQSR